MFPISFITNLFFTITSCFTLFIVPLLLLFDIRYYVIKKDDEKTRALSKALQKTTINTVTLFQCGNFYPSGYFVGWRCVGYYNYADTYDNVSAEIHLFTSAAYFKRLFETEKQSITFSNAPVSTKTNPLTIYSRTGSYMNIFYSRLRIDVQGLEPKGRQQDIVEDICSRFTKHRRGVFFIHGVSGAGKSTVGLLIASRLNGTFCHTFNPTEPGDTLQNILRDSDPTDERPTIILLEEANELIRAAHGETVQKHKNITTRIHNKSTYNTFMDDLILYRNVMIVMTSNEDKREIDALDPCYLRKGRVDEYYSMMESLLEI
jgi:hypothetical protein